MKQGRYFKSADSRDKTLGDAIERYLQYVLTEHNPDDALFLSFLYPYFHKKGEITPAPSAPSNNIKGVRECASPYI